MFVLIVYLKLMFVFASYNIKRQQLLPVLNCFVVVYVTMKITNTYRTDAL